MSTLKTNNIEHLDATSPSIEVNAAGGIQVGGALTATTGTFSGNVSIAGVLTYEDVTNIDSVGIITAQSGVNVTGGTFQLGNSSGSNVIIAQNTGIDINDGQLNLYTATSNVNAAPFIVSTDVGGIETEKFRITAGGSVGINTNAPDKKLTVFTDSNAGYSTETNNTPTGQSLIKLRNKNGGDGTGVNNYAAIEYSIAYGATSSGWLGYTRTGDNTGAFFMKQRNSASSYPETIRFPSSGGVTFGGGANTANTLDDYEFGNWTPVIKSASNVITLTDTTQSYFRYIKVGRLVKLFFSMNNATTSGSTGGTCTIGGLPYAIVSETNNRFISGDAIFYNSGFGLSSWPVYPHMAAGDTTMNLYEKGSAAAPYGSVTVSSVGSNGYFFFTIEYYTS